MTDLSTKEHDALAYFESTVKELCDKNIDKPEMFPSFNSIKNRECYLDDLVEVANLAEEVLKKVRKRIEQVNVQQKEEIDKFDEQIKKLKQHNLEIAGKLTDISDSLEKANSSKELTSNLKELMPSSGILTVNRKESTVIQKEPTVIQKESTAKILPKKQQEFSPVEIPASSKLKPAQNKNSYNFTENHHEFGDIMHLLDDSFSRELLPTENNKDTEYTEENESESKPNKLQKSIEMDSEWRIVTSRKHSKRTSAGPYAQIYDTDAMNLPVYKPVVVAGEYAIKAVICNDWPEITEMLEGCMYYVASADHFAIKLCGVMLHGNIGEIYTNERNPIKIKECKFGADCNKDNCEYYHDPLFSVGKKDIRNYIAGSFLYSPLTGFKPKSIGSRKIGSRSTIESDINRLDEYDIKLHRDQVMHDLLCCLLVPL